VSNPFLGQIMLGGWNFAPKGWALCNGQTMPINQNQALFSLLGTTYGGNGQTTFALPNLQSRLPIHQGEGQGLSNYTLGQTAGIPSVTLDTNTMPAHAHLVTQPASKDEETTNRPNGAYFTVGGTYAASANADSPMGPSLTSATGGTQPHTNLQPSLCVSFVIALQGVFPSRN
jgi:microcystin-dependent protein